MKNGLLLGIVASLLALATACGSETGISSGGKTTSTPTTIGAGGAPDGSVEKEPSSGAGW